MEATIICPKCGNDQFAHTEETTLDNLAGTTCSQCNHELTKEEAIESITQQAAAMMREKLKNFQ